MSLSERLKQRKQDRVLKTCEVLTPLMDRLQIFCGPDFVVETEVTQGRAPHVVVRYGPKSVVSSWIKITPAGGSIEVREVVQEKTRQPRGFPFPLSEVNRIELEGLIENFFFRELGLS